MALTNAIIKAGSKALGKATEEAITKSASKAIADATTKAVTRGLTGALGGVLAKNSGSTLDGILGRSSGLSLPEPKINTVSLAERLNTAYPDEYVDGVGGLMQKMDTSLDDLYKNKKLSKDSYETLRKAGREGANFINDVESANAIGVSSKSNLPMLNRDQYYYDTLGSMRNPDGSLNKYVSSADVPSYMQNHLSNTTKESNDSILRELFGDNDSDLSDLYEKYEKIADGGNANEIYTPENINMGVMIGNGDADEAIQDLADRVFMGKKDIPVSSRSSGAKNVKVSRPVADMGVEEAVAEPVTTTNPALAEDIAELKAQVGSAGGGMRGGGTPTATASPDYGGLGDSGFNVKLKDGETTNIKVGPEAVGSTKQQMAKRKLDDMTAKSFNPKDKQYAKIVGKSNSIDNYYSTVAERARAEKLDPANVGQKATDALNLRENIKQQGLQYAEANGVTMDLSGIDNSLGLSSVQKRRLAEEGLSLEDMLGGATNVPPTKAEQIYQVLRDFGWKWNDPKQDRITQLLGDACEKEAKAVREIIDSTMDSINVDYKTPLIEEAAKNGEDPAYLRKIAGKTDFKFSDLRRDQSDWLSLSDVAKNKMKDDKVPGSFTEAIGQGFKKGADKVKEKWYERQAYGGGSGGNTGGGGIPPTGGSGAENNINFETVGGGRTGTLGNLLGRAKGAGLVGAGLLGGMMLGGGGSSSGGNNFADAGQYGSYTQETEPEVDPYDAMTIGGYTYDQLENGYVNALQAGDADAAKLIGNMIGMLEDKIDRYNKAKEKDTGGIASKQRSAMNVLSGLMSNYQAQGPIGGRFTQFMNAITGGGYNPTVAAYDSGSAGSLGTIIKALGDTGALSEGDQRRALELLPKTTDSEEAARYKYQQLMQILQGAGAQ